MSKKSRVDRLERTLSAREECETFGEWLRRELPGADAIDWDESELAHVVIDAALAVAKRLGIACIPEAAPRDRAIAYRAIYLALRDHATRILRGDRTPAPRYHDHGLGEDHADRPALDDLIRRAKAER